MWDASLAIFVEYARAVHFLETQIKCWKGATKTTASLNGVLPETNSRGLVIRFLICDYLAISSGRKVPVTFRSAQVAVSQESRVQGLEFGMFMLHSPRKATSEPCGPKTCCCTTAVSA